MHVLAVFGAIDWGIVGVYFALVIAVGFAVARKDESEGEFFLGGRSMPTWAVAISLVATMLSAATFVGVPDIAFKGDLSYLILNIGGLIAVFLVAALFIPRLYAAGTVTIYGFLAQRFGENARLAVSCAFIAGRLLSSAARLFTASIPLCLLLFGTPTPSFGQLVLAIALIGIIGTIYATAGGVRAVVWVDTIQFTIVIGTALLTIGILMSRLGIPLSDMFSALAHPPAGTSKLRVVDTSLDPSKEYTLWTALLGNTFLMTAALGVDHDLAQRFLITKSAFRGAISTIASQFISIVIVALFMFIGLLLYLFYLRSELSHAPGQRPDNLAVYPWFLLHELPTGLAGLSIVGFFAIAQGSLDSAMNALAASIVSDVYHPLQAAHARRSLTSATGDATLPAAPTPHGAPKLTVAVVGVFMTLLAMICAAAFDPKASNILSFVLSLMPFAYSGMLGVFLTALLTNRGNSASVIAALIVGAVIVLLFQPFIARHWTPHVLGTDHLLAWPWWMPIATTAAFLVCIAGSPKSQQRGFPLD